jgi:hypothetical protein
MLRGGWASHQHGIPLNAPQAMGALHAAQRVLDVKDEVSILNVD